jgi:DNA-3-methyladenine glycosylase
MEIDKRHNGHDLLSDDLHIVDPGSETKARERPRIVAAPRIGVDYAGIWAKRLLRFYIRGNPYVSRRSQSHEKR